MPRKQQRKPRWARPFQHMKAERSMKIMKTIVALVCIISGSCLGGPEDAGAKRTQGVVLPSDLRRAAEAFISAPKTNRFSLGETLSKVLPKCPETMHKDSGTGVHISYDYSKPSCFLTRADLVGLLGLPDPIYERTTSYIIKRGDGMLWYLSVDLHADYVVGSTIVGVQDKSASNHTDGICQPADGLPKTVKVTVGR